nr:immunoglobulin light chain junction region [Macaca mulatta]MOV72076.1 immunoglobulin light chain junction region [Macaca mulatta]MOV72080.1 immunoglobulin light chain junction region [Macaca mulatta]MOV72110.1 immunoglobulin light chain junction region [Macaca mulatta]MOV72113.1 immunoglobulin light chain junction region [Macaca mulatta]
DYYCSSYASSSTWIF